MMYIYRYGFWMCFTGLYFLKILVRFLPFLNRFKRIQKALQLYSIWRCGDRYYQIFHILAHIHKLSGMHANGKILYVGVQWYQWLEIQVLNRYFSEVTFVDIDKQSQKYTHGNPFICADISDISQVCDAQHFDCVIVSGLFYHYGLSKKFTNDTLKQVYTILKPQGVLITGVPMVAPGKIATEKNALKYFDPEILNGSHCHKVYETLKPNKVTQYWYYFEIFRKKV